MSPNPAAAIISPEIPQTNLGGLKKTEATKLPAVPIAAKIRSDILLAILKKRYLLYYCIGISQIKIVTAHSQNITIAIIEKLYI